MTSTTVAPVPGEHPTSAAAWPEHPRGPDGVVRRRDGDRLDVEVTVPVRAVADLALPGAEPETVHHHRTCVLAPTARVA